MTDPLADSGFWFPSTWLEAVAWIIVVAVIVGLYVVIRRTRVKSRDYYLDRKQRENEMRRNDPDMK